MIENAGNSLGFFNAIAMFLSMNIIFWFTWALYYMFRTIKILKRKKKKVYFTTYFNMVVSFLFLITFWYISIATPLQGNIIDSTSFGAIVIRPLILFEAVGTAINAREKYGRERNIQ